MKISFESSNVDGGHRGSGRVKNTRASRLARKSGVLFLLAVAGLVMIGFSQRASAANPTFAIVAPSEWKLPIVPHANVFMQTAFVQQNGRFWNGEGNKEDIAGSHLYVGITRFAQLFSFKSLPNVGFFWEILVPEIRLQGSGLGVSGLGDPLLDFSIYVKPTDNSTVGFQNLLSVPFGDQNLSNHFWEYLPDFFWDVNIRNWELDGTVGAGFASDKHVNGKNVDIGNTYYGQFSVMYNINDSFAPFVNFNYQYVEEGTFIDTGATAPGEAPVFKCVNPGSCHEDVVGGGMKFTFAATRWISIWYARGISGENTTRTNAVYLRFVNIF